MMCLVRRWQILKFKSVRKSCHSPFQPLFRPPNLKKNQLLAFPSKCNQEKNIDLQKVISFKWNVLISEKKYSCNGYPMPTFQNSIRNATKFSLITDHYRKRPRRESFTWNTGKKFLFHRHQLHSQHTLIHLQTRSNWWMQRVRSYRQTRHIYDSIYLLFIVIT